MTLKQMFGVFAFTEQITVIFDSVDAKTIRVFAFTFGNDYNIRLRNAKTNVGCLPLRSEMNYVTFGSVWR